MKKGGIRFLKFIGNLEKNLKKRSLRCSEILIYVILASLLPAFIFSLIYTIDISLFPKGTFIEVLNMILGEYLNPLVLFSSIVVGAVISVCLWSAIIHFISKLLKGKGNFRDTFNVFGIALIPILLLGWIPIVNVWSLIYSFAILVEGISIKHKLSLARTSLNLLVSLLLILTIYFFFLFF